MPGRTAVTESIMMHSLVRIPLAQPTSKLLILQYYCSSNEVGFPASSRRFLRLDRLSMNVRDSLSYLFADFAREYLSAGISWLTFSASKPALLSQNERALHRNSPSREACSHQNSSSARCFVQSAGRCAVKRINFLALSCGGCWPLAIAVVMSGASQRRRSST